MSERFEKLDPEKRRRILNAALKEFAEKGYEQASTNEIVKEAGIGKGMLFYYFGNKRELYHYLLDYSLNMISKCFLDEIDESIDDIIDRLAHISRLKLRFFMEYPEIKDFLGSVLLGGEAELPEFLKDKYERVLQRGYAKLYGKKTVDEKRLKEGIDGEKAYKLMEWAYRGFQEDLLKALKGKRMKDIDFDKYWDEFDEYLRIFKRCFYKQEGTL